MKIKVKEVFLDNEDIEIIFDELIKRADFKIILTKFTEIEGVKIIKETENESGKACLLSNGKFEFILVYSSDSFVWNYTYATKVENHILLKNLCSSFCEFV